MTDQEIIEHQAREMEFAQTDIGKAFRRFEQLTATAWVRDAAGHLKSAERAFEQQREAREEIVAKIEGLQGALNEAHRRINALGGYVDPDDKYGAGVSETIDRALAIIEELGGRDPAVQQGERKAS